MERGYGASRGNRAQGEEAHKGPDPRRRNPRAANRRLQCHLVLRRARPQRGVLLQTQKSGSRSRRDAFGVADFHHARERREMAHGARGGDRGRDREGDRDRIGDSGPTPRHRRDARKYRGGEEGAGSRRGVKPDETQRPEGNGKEKAMLPSPNVHLKTRSSAVKNGNGSTSRHRRAPLSATEATLLAYALFHGRLSAQQACRLAGANGAYFAIVNAMNDHERDLLGRGEILLADLANAKRNGHANGNGKSNDELVPETLLEHIQRSTPEQLVRAVKAY